MSDVFINDLHIYHTHPVPNAKKSNSAFCMNLFENRQCDLLLCILGYAPGCFILKKIDYASKPL